MVVPEMNRLRLVRYCSILLLLACAASNSVNAQDLSKQEFVGSTPCDALSREFLGGMPTDAPCHCITWQLTLLDGKSAGEPRKYTLVVKYGIPGRDDPNQLVDGPTAKLEGTFDVVHGSKANPKATVYRIHGPEKG